MLRAVVLGLALVATLGAAVATLVDRGAWPMLAFAAALLAGTVWERVGYRGSDPARRGGWLPTAERFRDEASGRMVAVWFRPASGERRYVEEGEPPPG